jgi:hypothetical protein
LIGSVYAFVLGYGLGRLVGIVYNQTVRAPQRALRLM